MSSGTFNLTPEQLALREARRSKKQKAATNPAMASPEAPSTSLVNLDKGQIVSRSWSTIRIRNPNASQPVRIMTWNLLAQCLVRRELFPNSDCLKSTQREHMLFREILSADADILCLQEVDRLEKLIPVLEKANYGHIYAAGLMKKHGCLVGFRKGSFQVRKHFFRTKNVANVVALEKVGHPGEGYVVATTHLFWHPSYAYERTRQAGILLREVVEYREKSGLLAWPCFLAGDFNFHPGEPGYALLTGDTLTPVQEQLLSHSRVVHVSVDQSVPLTNPAPTNEDENGGVETDPDKVRGFWKGSLAQSLAVANGLGYPLINEVRMSLNGQATRTTGRRF
ncbi:Endonuclease/exonuclease/phosphatase [Multifurca ochricompacta]|uniref:Endonuclease/exonuclease/phosphatase n=1 Tax=Multifurca ochricompacta TaxID=376703 RepID=A0AAD4MCW6_9AGAM|nr:Endonuclease/exonuclease/phosphatase [Multifurca ochricompacta]